MATKHPFSFDQKPTAHDQFNEIAAMILFYCVQMLSVGHFWYSVFDVITEIRLNQIYGNILEQKEATEIPREEQDELVGQLKTKWEEVNARWLG